MKPVLLLLCASFSFFTSHARKGIPIPVCFPCEKIITVKQLPTDDKFKDDKGGKLNLGYIYKEYGALWLPVWNNDGRYVLTNVKEDTYYDLSAEEITMLKQEDKIDIPSGSPLSFWKKIGGKLIVGTLLAFLIWGMLPSKNKKEVQPVNI